MKKLLTLFTVLAALTITTTAFATTGPFHEHEEARFSAIESTDSTQTTNIATNTAVHTQTADGLLAKRIARATYDVAVDGGTAAAHGLGVSLPANALVTQVYFYIVTQFTDGGSGTVALSCEDANNLFSAADITGNSAGAIVSGAPTGTAGDMVAAIAAECEITATVASAEQTAGKLILFVEYAVVE